MSWWKIFPIFKDRKLLNGTFFNNKHRSLANKTSLSFISCYASKINTHVYLQRGFRQYGIPQVNPFIISNNWFLECIKFSTELITQLIYKDFANANAHFVFRVTHIQLETVSISAAISTLTAFSSMEWTRTFITSANVRVVFALLA